MSTSREGEVRRTVSGYVSAIVAGGVVVALPLVAHMVNGSADEFSRRRWQVGPALGWLWCAVLVAVIVTRRLQIAVRVEEGVGLAVAYDALPVLLVRAWVVAVSAAVWGHWLWRSPRPGYACITRCWSFRVRLSVGGRVGHAERRDCDWRSRTCSSTTKPPIWRRGS